MRIGSAVVILASALVALSAVIRAQVQEPEAPKPPGAESKRRPRRSACRVPARRRPNRSPHRPHTGARRGKASRKSRHPMRGTGKRRG